MNTLLITLCTLLILNALGYGYRNYDASNTTAQAAVDVTFDQTRYIPDYLHVDINAWQQLLAEKILPSGLATQTKVSVLSHHKQDGYYKLSIVWEMISEFAAYLALREQLSKYLFAFTYEYIQTSIQHYPKVKIRIAAEILVKFYEQNDL